MDDRNRRDRDDYPRRDLNRDVRYPYGARYGYRVSNEFEARDRWNEDIAEYERDERARAHEQGSTERDRSEQLRPGSRSGGWYGSNSSLGSKLDTEVIPHSEARWNVPGPFRGKGPKGYARSDERIREEVSERLLLDGSVDALDIDVAVNEGTVRLTGSVPERNMKWISEEIVRSVFGVKDIENQLRVD